MSKIQSLIDDAHGILSMCRKADKREIYRGLFSGGKDSLVACHLAATYFGDEWDGVAYVNTDTGPISHRHAAMVQRMAAEQGWDIVTASPSTTFPMLVVKMGFPGPGMHGVFYRMLKERSVRTISQILRKGHRGYHIYYVTGIRRAESTRRSDSPTHWDETKTKRWVSPLLNWREEHVREYMVIHGLSVPNMEHSVDCGCGAFAKPGEREMLMQDEEQRQYILNLEAMVELARRNKEAAIKGGFGDGSQIKPEFCKWGHGLNSGDVTENEGNPISLCNDCIGQLTADRSRVGVDPDEMMIAAKRDRYPSTS